MATIVPVTVGPDPGDDYGSIRTAEAGEERDLPALDEISRIICRNFVDVTGFSCYFSGWVVDATRYIDIVTENAHPGYWDATKYVLDCQASDSFGYAIRFGEKDMRVDGLQIDCNHLGANVATAMYISGAGANGDIRIANNIIKLGTATANSRNGIVIEYSAEVWNNIIYDFKGGGGSCIGISATTFHNHTAWMYHNTVVNCITGFSEGGNVLSYLRNNIAQDNTTDYAGTYNTHSNNISGDGTSPDGAFQNKTVTFKNKVGRDLRLDTSDTEAKDNGIDLSANPDGAPVVPLRDIVGTLRPEGSGWDIGAFELPQAVAGGIGSMQVGKGLITLGNKWVGEQIIQNLK